MYSLDSVLTIVNNYGPLSSLSLSVLFESEFSKGKGGESARCCLNFYRVLVSSLRTDSHWNIRWRQSTGIITFLPDAH